MAGHTYRPDVRSGTHRKPATRPPHPPHPDATGPLERLRTSVLETTAGIPALSHEFSISRRGLPAIISTVAAASLVLLHLFQKASCSHARTLQLRSLGELRIRVGSDPDLIDIFDPSANGPIIRP